MLVNKSPRSKLPMILALTQVTIAEDRVDALTEESGRRQFATRVNEMRQLLISVGRGDAAWEEFIHREGPISSFDADAAIDGLHAFAAK